MQPGFGRCCCAVGGVNAADFTTARAAYYCYRPAAVLLSSSPLGSAVMLWCCSRSIVAVNGAVADPPRGCCRYSVKTVDAATVASSWCCRRDSVIAVSGAHGTVVVPAFQCELRSRQHGVAVVTVAARGLFPVLVMMYI